MSLSSRLVSLFQKELEIETERDSIVSKKYLAHALVFAKYLRFQNLTSSKNSPFVCSTAAFLSQIGLKLERDLLETEYDYLDAALDIPVERIEPLRRMCCNSLLPLGSSDIIDITLSIHCDLDRYIKSFTDRQNHIHVNLNTRVSANYPEFHKKREFVIKKLKNIFFCGTLGVFASENENRTRVYSEIFYTRSEYLRDVRKIFKNQLNDNLISYVLKFI